VVVGPGGKALDGDVLNGGGPTWAGSAAEVQR
jgi:hypothetical protein